MSTIPSRQVERIIKHTSSLRLEINGVLSLGISQQCQSTKTSSKATMSILRYKAHTLFTKITRDRKAGNVVLYNFCTNLASYAHAQRRVTVLVVMFWNVAMVVARYVSAAFGISRLELSMPRFMVRNNGGRSASCFLCSTMDICAATPPYLRCSMICSAAAVVGRL